MECLEAMEVLAAAIDGAASEELLKAAREHCKTCASCEALAATLDRLAAHRAPVAPEHLVATVLGRVREEAAADARAARVLTETLHADTPARGRLAVLRTRRPATRYLAFAAMAAALVVGLAVGNLLLVGGHEARLQGSAAMRDGADLSDSLPAAPESSSESYGAAPTSEALQEAPPLVTLGSDVYRLSAALSELPANASAVGTVASAFDSADATPSAQPAYRVASDPLALIVVAPDGSVLRFEAVVRSVGGVACVLQSGSPIERFGLWPTLPAAFTPPTAPDGSPTFRRFGSDDTGVPIYVPPGSSPRDGFAVAPGTDPVRDPAAGAPVWTWWRPIG